VVFFIVVNVLSLVCLVWALHGLHFRQLLHRFAHLQWRWVALAMASTLLSYAVQGWRWSLLLAPVAPVRFRDSTRAVLVGVYANDFLPLRSGEIIRAYLLARSSEIPMSVTLASVLIERVFDGIWLVIGMFVTLRMVTLPPFIKDSGIFVGILILLGGGLLAVAMYWREQTLDWLLNARWFGWVHVLIKDLHLIGHSRYLYYAFGLSLPFLFLQAFPAYAVLRAYDGLNHLPFSAALAVAVILRFNSAVPQAPGNFTTYPLAVIAALRPFGPKRPLPGFDLYREMSRQFSVILFAITTIPVLVAGFIAVAFTGMKIADIHRDAKTSLKDRDVVPVSDSAAERAAEAAADESAGLS
jgi:uncharacterized membrane protein YbhN (UPF0104 family)